MDLLDVDDLEFVSPPPEYIHLKCPVCFDILSREPHLVDCCGQHFCARCIRSLRDQGRRACPMCKSDRFESLLDKNQERVVRALRVYCSNKPEGCPWEGELRRLADHLSVEYDIEEGCNLCQYVEIQCIYKCGAKLRRLMLGEHMMSACPKRPFVCEHCHKYSSTWENVTTVHYRTCDQAPTERPDNKSGDTTARELVQNCTTPVTTKLAALSVEAETEMKGMHVGSKPRTLVSDADSLNIESIIQRLLEGEANFISV